MILLYFRRNFVNDVTGIVMLISVKSNIKLVVKSLCLKFIDK